MNEEDQMLCAWLWKRGYRVLGPYTDFTIGVGVSAGASDRAVPPTWLNLYVWRKAKAEFGIIGVRVKPTETDVVFRSLVREWMLGL